MPLVSRANNCWTVQQVPKRCKRCERCNSIEIRYPAWLMENVGKNGITCRILRRNRMTASGASERKFMQVQVLSSAPASIALQANALQGFFVSRWMRMTEVVQHCRPTF
jgi:hypothetical protein